MRDGFVGTGYGQAASPLRVKVPLPFPLRWVNAYLLKEKDGYTLVDPGLRTPEAAGLWEETLERLGIGFGDISRIVLTHHHPDHYGLAGWFQQRSGGAPVWLSEAGAWQARRLWGEDRPLTAEIHAQFLRHGMDEATAGRMIPHMESFVPLVSPQPALSILAPGGTIAMGGRDWRVLETNGHAAGHLCFYDPSGKIILCGDQVLPRISPNISLIPGVDANPLVSFLDSLASLSELEVGLAYPGHRDPFDGFGQRTLELIRHHRERLDAMLALLDRPATAYTVCEAVFGSRLTVHQLRFAMSETIAHLAFLREEGRTEEMEREGVIAYRRR